jgi:hypothetical protein
MNMFIIGLIGFLFFGAIGYFAYTLGQCVCVFSRLDNLINKKLIGALSVLIYFYLVYVNQDSLLAALIKPFESI